MPKGIKGFQKGHPTFVSKEAYKKIGDKLRGKQNPKLKGKIPWNKNKKGLQVAWNRGKKLGKLSDEQKMKIRAAVSKYLTGKRKPNWVKEKIRNTLIGRPLSETTKLKMMGRIPWNKNKPFYAIRGEKHWAWDKEKKKRYELRGRIEYKNWRKSVFKRDNYTCQMCGERGGELHADHIKPFAYFPELRLEIDNGRTLCKNCHQKTYTYLWKAIKKLQDNQE